MGLLRWFSLLAAVSAALAITPELVLISLDSQLRIVFLTFKIGNLSLLRAEAKLSPTRLAYVNISLSTLTCWSGMVLVTL